MKFEPVGLYYMARKVGDVWEVRASNKYCVAYAQDHDMFEAYRKADEELIRKTNRILNRMMEMTEEKNV